MKKNSFFRYYFVIAIVISVLFVLVYGVSILNPTSKDWIVVSSGDIYQHYVGWEAYRLGGWNFPIGITNMVSYPSNISIIYTDSIPIIAFIFKLISGILPGTFQYFGLYGLLCCILQGVLSAKIIKKYTNSKLIIILSSILLCIVPVFISRMYYHTALSSHYLIILSLSTLFLYDEYDSKKIYFIWGLVAFLTSTIHIYFIPMCGIILLGYILLDILNNKRLKRGLLLLIEYLIISVLSIWLFGGFVNLTGMDDYGLGYFSFNLNGLINSQGWSSIFGALPQITGHYEGFSYLGLGVIILLIMSLILVIIWIINDRDDIKKYKKIIISIVFILIISAFIALSPMAYAGKTLLYELSLPSIVEKIWGIFRSTGRFIWPVIYILMFLGIIVVIKRMRYKYVIVILLLVIVMQIIDIRNVLFDRFFYYSYSVIIYGYRRLDYFVELNSVIDNNDVKYLILVSDDISDFDKTNYSDWAINNGLKTNKMHFARTNFEKMLIQNTKDFLNNINKETIYIFTSKKECNKYSLYCYELPDNNYLGYINEIK